jgi:hypothetical protein
MNFENRNSIEINNQKNETEKEGEQMKIETTGDFNGYINQSLEIAKSSKGEINKEKIENARQLLCEAEKWFLKARQEPKYMKAEGKEDGWWADQQERALFRAYRQIGDFDGANRLIESMENTPHAQKVNSRAGRIEVLSREIEQTENS